MAVKTYNSVVRDFVNMADAMNRMHSAQSYDYARNGGNNGEHREQVRHLPLDVWANDETFFIKAFLPGINADDVEITFEGEDLTISGSYPVAEDEVDYFKRELYHGKFARTLTFNLPVNVEGIEAEFDSGVLTLSVPKAEEILPKRIEVRAK